VQTLGGLGETAGIGNGEESSEQARIQHGDHHRFE